MIDGLEGGGIPRRSALMALLAAPAVAGLVGRSSAQADPTGVLNVRAFGARGDGKAEDAPAIQAAIDAAAAMGAGVVWVPPGRYRLGAQRLVLLSGVSLRGAGVDWSHAPEAGVQLLYEGTGAAVLAQNVKHAAVEDLLIDFSGSDESGGGVHLNGAWLSTLRNLRILSSGRHGHSSGVLIDTNDGTWGAQHLYLERLEVPSSTVRLRGTGPNDQVTTTLINVVRGLRYDLDWATAVTLIDTTAENFSDVGIRIHNSDQATLVGVDIEGPGDIGLALGPHVRSLVAMGLSFTGFTGRARIEGRPQSGMLTASMEPTTFWGPVRWVDGGGPA